MVLISPSILSSDFSRLAQEVLDISQAGADLVHVDVMDGHFVPNITIGLPVVESLKKVSPIPLDVHLMISNPLFYAEKFARAGADIVTFHIESGDDVRKTIDSIKSAGAKAGISVKPKTPVQEVFKYLEYLDMVLIMTVEPGFGGQSFMSDMLPKISGLKSECVSRGLKVDIQVDGGVDENTAAQVARAGANVLVAGSAIFKEKPYEKRISVIRAAADAAAG